MVKVLIVGNGSMSLRPLLKKISVFAGFISLFLLILYIITGLSVAGRFGFNKFIDKETALFLHANEIILFTLIVAVALHTGIEIYFLILRFIYGKGEKKG